MNGTSFSATQPEDAVTSRTLLGRCGPPAMLLVVVALTQRYLMQNQQLDPWKCGGFGMFSAISARNLRQMTVTLIPLQGDEKRFPPATVANRIPLDGEMTWYRLEILTMPHPALLQGLADKLADGEWVAVSRASTRSESLVASTAAEHPASPGPGRGPPPAAEYYRMKQDVPQDAATRPLPLREVRVEVWEYRLRHDLNQLELTRLATATSQPRVTGRVGHTEAGERG